MSHNRGCSSSTLGETVQEVPDVVANPVVPDQVAPAAAIISFEEICFDVFNIQKIVGGWLTRLQADNHTEPMRTKLDTMQLQFAATHSMVEHLEKRVETPLSQHLIAANDLHTQALDSYAELKAMHGDLINSMMNHFDESQESKRHRGCDLTSPSVDGDTLFTYIVEHTVDETQFEMN